MPVSCARSATASASMTRAIAGVVTRSFLDSSRARTTVAIRLAATTSHASGGLDGMSCARRSCRGTRHTSTSSKHTGPVAKRPDKTKRLPLNKGGAVFFSELWSNALPRRFIEAPAHDAPVDEPVVRGRALELYLEHHRIERIVHVVDAVLLRQPDADPPPIDQLASLPVILRDGEVFHAPRVRGGSRGNPAGRNEVAFAIVLPFPYALRARGLIDPAVEPIFRSCLPIVEDEAFPLAGNAHLLCGRERILQYVDDPSVLGRVIHSHLFEHVESVVHYPYADRLDMHRSVLPL